MKKAGYGKENKSQAQMGKSDYFLKTNHASLNLGQTQMRPRGSTLGVVLPGL